MYQIQLHSNYYFTFITRVIFDNATFKPHVMTTPYTKTTSTVMEIPIADAIIRHCRKTNTSITNVIRLRAATYLPPLPFLSLQLLLLERLLHAQQKESGSVNGEGRVLLLLLHVLFANEWSEHYLHRRDCHPPEFPVAPPVRHLFRSFKNVM